MSQNENEPMMVLNPNTGRWVNVRPLMDLAYELDGPSHSFSNAAFRCRNSARMLIEYANPDGGVFEDLQQAFTNLNTIADAFDNVQEFDHKPRK